MNRIPNSRDDLESFLQTSALLQDLQQMSGRRCGECAESLCGHETLMSLVAGFKSSPLCLSCLSRLMGQGVEEVRDLLLGYITSRPCRQAGWLWANQEEGLEPTARPTCLWPAAGVAGKTSQEVQIMMDSTGQSAPPPNSDADWDAGSLGCGELVMGLRMRLQSMKPGQILKLTATDAGVPEDLPAWCRLTGHKLVSCNHPEYWIQRREN